MREEDAPRRDDSAPGDDVTRGDQGTKLCERMVRARRMLHVTRGDEAMREGDRREEVLHEGMMLRKGVIGDDAV